LLAVGFDGCELALSFLAEIAEMLDDKERIAELATDFVLVVRMMLDALLAKRCVEFRDFFRMN